MTVENNQTLGDWLAAQASLRPDATALVDMDGAMNYGELASAVSALGSGLAGLGIGKGDVVAVQLPNIRAFVIAFLAIAARGAIVQTLHMPYRSKELGELLKDSAAKAVIATNAEKDSRSADILSVRDQLPALNHVIVAGPVPDGCSSLSDLMQTQVSAADAVPVTTDDRYLLLYTSGTTAAPKGVPHIYRSFLNNARSSSHELGVGQDDRILSLAPMSHLYGLFTVHLALASGAAIILLPAFDPKTVLEDLQNTKPSHVFAAPAHFAPFEAQGVLHPDHLTSVRLLCLSGATVPRALASAIDSRMPEGKVIQLWGMSELQAGTFGRLTDPEDKRFSTAGKAVPNTELRVVDDAGTPLSAGEEGALQVRGPSVFGGYLNRPEETQSAFDAERWFSTGDLAIIDNDGFMSITGRTKEIINRGGVKFNPVEMEEILLNDPSIQQCAIIPIPDPILGEKGCLCVQLAPGGELALESVTARLERAGVAKYKWPEDLLILNELPATPTRKIMRGALIEIVQNQKEKS
ncbi:class I adenylate-forming enzyme family protein [uncultured Ruegeria sp.]|uniref:class I adenylate-forming enzyme family protein n=1 Tax=uncultured Ruegeria sp. TaxID=259304 RepID=UPI002608B7DE|nr:class I adenylate-forming enzyme family protein [uncultured Ruegeria sp.]